MKFIILFILCVDFAVAGNLTAPNAFENALVLPAKIRNLRYRNIQAQANDKYDQSGANAPVGQDFNKAITFKDLIDGQDTDIEKGVLEGYLGEKGIDPNSSAGKTSGVVNISVNAQIPIMAYGISDKLTTAIAVPYVTTRTNIDTGYVSSPEINKICAGLIAEGKKFKCDDIRIKTSEAINRKAQKYGYKPLTNEEKKMLGDIRVVNKYLFDKKDTVSVALLQTLTLPTGKEIDPDKVVDVGAGDGQWDIGAGVNADYSPLDNVIIGSFVQYTAQLADNTSRRIPEKSDSSLSPDKDPNVKRDIGDIFQAGTSIHHQIVSGLTFSTGYLYQHKDKDVYSGNNFSNKRYGWLSRNTNQNMHAFQLGAEYSTLPMFRSKKFPVPLQAILHYSKPVKGVNVVKDGVTTFEFSMFF